MNYREYNDNELLYYIREENEDANEIMFNKYKPLISSLASRHYSKCANRGLEMSDLIQEGMIGLSYAIASYKEDRDASFYTYAKTCIERKILSSIRTTGTLKNKILNDSISIENSNDEYNLTDIIGDNSVNPENMALSYEKQQEIYNLARKVLTNMELQVYELKVAGFNYKEIADVLNVDTKTIDNALQRIKNKLKKVLIDD